MYRMKNIVSFDSEVTIPKCMYGLKNIVDSLVVDEVEIKISDQKAPITEMTELEERQDLLLKKLDLLYDRIKTISSFCNFKTNHNATPRIVETKNICSNVTMDEIVVVLSPDNIPWFLNIYKKHAKDINISWHIHSSVPVDKKQKIFAFFKRFAALYPALNSKINIRLIFKCVAADTELKLSCLEIPIVGIVNVLRYLAIAYPNVAPYDFNDFQVDSLLDLCCLLERSPEKNKEALIKKLFSPNKNWIYGNKFSIVDLAVYNIVKQWQNSTKYVPKTWFDNCEKIIN
ncbi:uncharacterized protein AIMP2 isoform X2 [Epargyreus clarus]|uniref:uncharacterized protein AIMP2 isoform X2 n=1 Tax=Epargyreus clarus TaxID=520877 RepID=UPI003C2BDFF4